MDDRSWQAVTVADWQQGPGGRWRCLLIWGNWGTLDAGWFVYDAGRLRPFSRGRDAAGKSGGNAVSTDAEDDGPATP